VDRYSSEPSSGIHERLLQQPILSPGGGFWQDDKKGSITPALPQARQDALLPELRSRLANILNVP
jgi:hypothetical protein